MGEGKGRKNSRYTRLLHYCAGLHLRSSRVGKVKGEEDADDWAARRGDDCMLRREKKQSEESEIASTIKND